MARVASIHRRGSMSIAMTRNTVNGAVRWLMARAVSIRPRASIAMDRAPTSASGAAPPPTVPVASTALPASTRNKMTIGFDFFNNFTVVVDRLGGKMTFVKN